MSVWLAVQCGCVPVNSDVSRHKMHERRFSDWTRWRERSTIADGGFPGVYAISRSSEDISGARFSWTDRIIYVGMTNGISGLSGRLAQFDNTISGRRLGHGGADRVRLEFPNYDRLSSSLFVAVAPFKCNPKSDLPKDLRAMGDVARFEFICLAEYAQKFGSLPKFNDKRASPKYSKVKR